MNHTFKINIVILASVTCGWGQTVNFTDLELKRYLTNEMCVDTTHNGVAFSNDVSVDLNGDNEIQLTEALVVEAIELIDFLDNYTIKSLLDLNEFSNLKYLKIIDNDSLKRITNLNLDSLKTLWISDGTSLKNIDISNLPNITTTLRIEGLTTLDTLNIQNGTSANQFSLFYTQDIKYACIDSIPNEINEFTNSGAMLPEVSPTFNCGVLSANENNNYKNQLQVHPNPTDDYIIVDTEKIEIGIRILTIEGKEVIQSDDKIIDVSMLPPGVYFLQCSAGNNYITKKIIIK